MGSYNKFAEYYDTLTMNINYHERAVYFDSLIKETRDCKGILLDLGCGTGSLCEEFAKMGYDVLGVDSSSEMLSLAYQKKVNSGHNIQYVKQDMTKLELYGEVDVTICALDSINHLSNLNAIKKTFGRVSKYTKKHGIFIFDINTVYKHRKILGNNTYVYEAEEVYCVWQNSYEEKDNRVKIDLDFFEKNGNLYKRSNESFFEVAYSEELIDKGLVDSGFEIVNKYDYDSKEAVREDSEKLIYVARKV